MLRRNYIIAENSTGGYITYDEDGAISSTQDRDLAKRLTQDEAVEYLQKVHGKFWQARASLIKLREEEV